MVEDPKTVYEAKCKLCKFTAICFATLLALYLLVAILSFGEILDVKGAFGAIALLIFAVFYSFAYRNVQEIVLYEDQVEFLPDGFCLRFEDIDRVDSHPIPENGVIHFSLLMKTKHRKWVPAYLFWNERECGITFPGENGGEIFKDFSKKLSAFNT